ARRRGFEHEISAFEYWRRASHAAPHQSLHARFELVKVERLGEIVVRAEVEAFDLVLYFSECGQDQDWYFATTFAQPAQHLLAGQVRQAEVEHDQRIGLGGRHFDRAEAACLVVDGN